MLNIANFAQALYASKTPEARKPLFGGFYESKGTLLGVLCKGDSTMLGVKKGPAHMCSLNPLRDLNLQALAHGRHRDHQLCASFGSLAAECTSLQGR